MDNENYKLIDDEIFNQLLDIEEDDSKDFTRGLVQDFFQQVDESIVEFKELLDDCKVIEAGKLGHYLKGSSAMIGVTKVKDVCEDIQMWQQKVGTTKDAVDYIRGKVELLKIEIERVKPELYKRVN